MTNRSEDKIQAALAMIGEFGGYDGGHHKQWVIDQVVRILTGDEYDDWIIDYCGGENGPDTYEWDEGIPP